MRAALEGIKRWHVSLSLVAVIAIGIASRRFPMGSHLWDKSLGDALYTVMLYLLAAFVRPALVPWKLGAIALGTSIAIEAFQLTEIPARLPRVLQYAFGTTFAWHDIACYVVGAIVATTVHALAQRVLTHCAKPDST